MFCPADRPDRYLKALAAADVVILDLEDAVAPAAKATARKHIQALAKAGDIDVQRTVLRLNAAHSAEHDADVATAVEADLQMVMLAKSEDPREVRAIPLPVIVLIETPRGLEQAGSLAEPENVLGMMWGADDLVAGLGGFSSRHPDGAYRDIALYARNRVLVAAKAYDRIALDGVHMDIADLEGLAAECEDAVSIGFDASVAIHPSQLDVIRSSYAPSPERVDWAARLLTYVGESRGVTTFEGRMVDGPIFKQAERLLRLAQSIEQNRGDG